MNVSVIIPMSLQDRWRQDIYSWVLARFYSLHPDWEICTAGNDLEPFSRSRARNEAAAKAHGDVFLVCDADTFANNTLMNWSVEIADEHGCCFPYGDYYNLSEDFTRIVLKADCKVDVNPPTPELYEFKLKSVGGMYAIRRDVWEAIGGYDESFVGWGYEDNAFALAVETLFGPPHRIEGGFVCHLWHPAPESVRFDQPDISLNKKRYEKYQKAKHSPTRMMELCRGSR